MRQRLDIYASLTLCKTLPGFPTRHKNVDIVIVRENTEGEYSGLEHSSYPGVVESLKVSTRAAAERISRFAFDFALKNNRKRVVCVHKANIMKLVSIGAERRSSQRGEDAAREKEEDLRAMQTLTATLATRHHQLSGRWFVPQHVP